MSAVVCADMNMLIFDGAYIKCMSLETEILILEACAACKEAVVPLEVKSWPSTLPLVLPGLALRSGLAVVRPDEMLVRTYPNCLINVIASLCPACDASSFQDYDDALSAESFNTTIVHSSQRATDAGFRLVHVAHNDLMEPQPSATFYAHYPLPNGLGHWYGLQYLESKLISIVDVDAGGRRLDLSCEALSRLLEEDRCSTWFRLDLVSHELPEETGPEYKLQGSMMRSDMAQSSTQEIVTPLTCQECGAPLAPAHAVSGRLYTLRGMEDMSMIIQTMLEEDLSNPSSLQLQKSGRSQVPHLGPRERWTTSS